MKLYAIVARERGPEAPEELIGLIINGQSMACVSTHKKMVEWMFMHVAPEVKAKGARIVEFDEVKAPSRAP